MAPTTGQIMEAPTAAEIVSTRLFVAPREAVFGAFVDPSLLARWWGPKGFANTFHEFDPRPGGAWRFTMRSPDGAEFENANVFVEVAPLERIVFDHLEPVHGFRMTMTFGEEAGGTRLTWRMRFESVAEAERVRPFVVVANEENFDRLGAVVHERRQIIG